MSKPIRPKEIWKKKNGEQLKLYYIRIRHKNITIKERFQTTN